MAKTQTCRLLLVRAGSTEWDDAGRLQGSVDLPLSEGSRREMPAQLAGLVGVELSAVVCGPDEASRETAETLAEATGSSVRIVDELREMNLGLWEGMLAEDFEKRYPRACQKWLDDPASVVAPEGDCLEDVRERVLTAVRREVERQRRVGAVGLVLRPFVWGIVHCWLRSCSLCEFWAEAKEAGRFQWFDVPRAGSRPAPQAAAIK